MGRRRTRSSTYRFSEDVRAAIERLAEERGVTQTEIVETAVRDFAARAAVERAAAETGLSREEVLVRAVRQHLFW